MKLKQQLTIKSRHCWKIFSILLSASILALPVKGETIAYHFDSPEEIPQFDSKINDLSAVLETTQTAAGAGALKPPTGFQASFPKDWTEGVLSFGVYDTLSTGGLAAVPSQSGELIC